jgi:Cupin-like domain
MSLIDRPHLQDTTKLNELLPDRIVAADSSQFRELFNRASFQFSHNLAGHPLFEIPRLVELTNLILSQGNPHQITCVSSYSAAQQKWSAVPYQEKIAESIAHIDSSGSFVMITGVQIDSDYKALLEHIILELEELTGVALRQEITWLDAYIFISSPHNVTPYHIDHEPNFLLQIQGEKTMNLFDPSDRSVLTEMELENYYIGDREYTYYKPDKQDIANVYHLVPGQGVHHPSTAPHWVKNGSQVSVSLSINFCMRSLDQRARVYQVNHYLRKLGLTPTPPDHSRWKDNAKILSLGMFSKRDPETKNELLRSGINRLKSPFKLLKRS